jgi:two-component system chemotaxis sensor kinase CheA
MDRYTEHYRKQFYQEARDILEKISEDILHAEAEPENQELLNAIFRGIHTIKGSAGSFDLENLAEFSHHLEGVLSGLRDGKISLTSELVDLILAGTDHIGKMVEDYASGSKADIDQNLTAQFQSFCAVSQEKPEIQALSSDTPEPLSKPGFPASEDIPVPSEAMIALQNAAAIGLYIFRVQVKYSSELLENGYDPLVFLKNLKKSCTFYHVTETDIPVPPIDEFSPLSLYLYPCVYVATALSAEEIRDLTFDPSLAEVEEIHVRMEDFHAEPLHEFVDSAVEMLESLEKAVIDYETSGSREALNEIFRVVHNFKGDADLIGLEEITMFAHALESLLERLRAGTIHRSFALVDTILQSVDFLRQSVVNLGQGDKIHDFPPVFKTLKHYAAMKDDLEREQSLLKDATPELQEVFNEQASQYKDILMAHLRPLPLNQERRKIIERSLKGLAKASAFVGLKSLQVHAEKAVAALGEEKYQLLYEVVEKIAAFIDGMYEEVPKEDVPGRISLSDYGASKPADTTGTETRTMRIDEHKVDHFTNLVSELLIARNTYSHLVKQLETAEDSSRKLIKSLKDNLHLFSRLTSDIHHGVMSLRMIPVKKIFHKFNRVVRDISRKQKKSIHLLTGGEDIEIDKKIADMLSEPLVHLLRNACDHGIELPDERRAAGKPERGTVIIRASQEGSNLYISIIDDGKGIDRHRLYDKAKKLGIDISSPDDPALPDMIFIPGLSTSTEISEISGRGVGLDAVKATVRSLGGTVRVISNEGKGMEVSLSIPITLGIDTVLFVEAGGTSYAIPLEHIVETLKIPSQNIKKAGRQTVFYHRGEVLPAERLDKLIMEHGTKRPSRFLKPRRSDDMCSVVIVRTSQGKYGMIVDRLDKNTEVAVKPMPGILANIDIVSGVSIMGDGKVFLVLNPEKLF